MSTFAHHRSFAALVHDRRGSISLYFAMVLMFMALLMVAALDLIRTHMVKSRLGMAVDSAILAAGGSLGNVNGAAAWRNVGVAFFNANMNASMGGGVTIKPTDFDSTPTALGTTEVKLSVNTSVSMMSAGLGNLKALTIKSEATAQRRNRTAELVMVLDNTGSMRYNGGMTALTADSLMLVSILADGKTAGNLSNMSVGIVPYAASVNPGAETSSYATGHIYNPGGKLDWKGCLIEPTGDGLARSDTPGDKGWRQYYAPNDVDNNYVPGKASTVFDEASKENATTGPNVGCPTPITPLTTDIGTLNAALNAMVPWHRGGTISDLGLAWGLRVLSPGAPFTGGAAFGTTDKVLVMMTDGAAGYFKLTGNAGTNSENTNVKSDYAGYGRVDQYGLLDVSNKDAATAKINTNITSLCTTIKGLGVRIYTITFGGLDKDTTDTYKGCASKLEYYFDSPSTAEMQRAFSSIAGDLTELVILK